MVLVGILAQLLLGVFFTLEGVMKWTHIGPSTARFIHFRYPTWFRYVTGVVEVSVGLGMLAALLLVGEMVMAIASHLVRGHDPFVPEAVPETVVFVLALMALVR